MLYRSMQVRVVEDVPCSSTSVAIIHFPQVVIRWKGGWILRPFAEDGPDLEDVSGKTALICPWDNFPTSPGTRALKNHKLPYIVSRCTLRATWSIRTFAGSLRPDQTYKTPSPRYWISLAL